MRWWILGLVVVAVGATLGPALLGLEVFAATDNLFLHAPWSELAPAELVPGNTLVADTVDAVLPRWETVRDRIAEGDFPLWTSLPSGGLPVGSVLNAALLGPLSLPYYLVPLSYAPALAKLLELLVAIGFTFLFLRRLGLTRAPALFGGFVFAFTGFQVVWTNWPQAGVGAFMPAVFWAVERTLQDPRGRNVALVALATAAIVLSGFPAVAAYGLVGAGIYALVRLARGPDTLGGPRHRVLLLVTAGGLLGLGLTAVQLVPFGAWLETVELGYREQSGASHLPFHALVTLAVPDAFGSPGDGFWFGPTNYIEAQGFVGASALVLVVLAATPVARRRLPAGAPAFLWGALAVMVLLVYVGGPPLRALQVIPGADRLFGINHIGRLKSLLGLVLAVLAAAGLEALLRRSGPVFARRVTRWAVAAAAVGLVVYLAARVGGEAAGLELGTPVLRQAVLPALVLAVAVAAVAWGRRLRNRDPRMVPVLLLPALFTVESLAFTLPYWTTVSHEQFYPTTSAHEVARREVGNDRLAAEHRTMYPGTTTYYGLRSVTAHAFQDPRWADLLRAADPAAFRSGTSDPPVRRATFPHLRHRRDVVASPVLDRLGARVFATAPWLPVFGERIGVAPRSGRSLTLSGGDTLRFPPPPPGKPLRAVVVDLARRYTPASGPAYLEARLLGPDGGEVASGRRRVWPTDPSPPLVAIADASVTSPQPGPFFVPVPERAPRAEGRREVEVVFDAPPDATLVLHASQDGRPAGSVVAATDDGLRLVHGQGAVLYERTDALPRFRWAGRARVIADPRERVRTLSRGLPDDVVVLSEPGPPGGGSDAAIDVQDAGGDRLAVDVRAQRPGYLVVADAIQNGWEVRVDGEPGTLVAADHALGAVHVPAGAHEVVFEYRPAGWTLGRWVSLAALGVVVVLASRRSRRRSHRTPDPGSRGQPVGQTVGSGS